MTNNKNDDVKNHKEGNDVGVLAMLAVVALTAILIISIPLGIAIIIWFFVKKYLSLKEYILTSLIGIAAMFITAAAPLIDYLHWVKKAVFDQDFVHFPLVSTLVLSTVIFGFLSILNTVNQSSKLFSIISWTPGKIITAGGLEMPSIKAHTKMAAPPESIVVQKQSTSTSGDAGNRMLTIGIDADNKPFGPTEAQIKTHMLLFGTTGSGKTVTLTTLIGSAADLGYDVLVLDLKQDLTETGLRYFCKTYAETNFRRYQEVHLDTSLPPTGYWFNALSGLDKDGAIDAILSTTEHDDQYHQSTFRLVLNAAMEVLYLSHEVDPSHFPEPNLYDLGTALMRGPSAWKERVAIVLSAFPNKTKEDYASVTKPTQHQQEQAISVGTRLTNVYGTEAAQRVLRPAPGSVPIDITQEGITYIGLNSVALQDLSKTMAGTILARVSAYVGVRNARGATRPTMFVIDEANYIDRQRTNNLLSMARSAKFPIVLCTQTPLQFDDAGGKNWFPTFATNTNVLFSMIQNETASAKVIADFFGTKEVAKKSLSFSDNSDSERTTLSMKEEYIVPIDVIRTLPMGQGILRIGAGPHVPPKHLRIIKRSPNAH